MNRSNNKRRSNNDISGSDNRAGGGVGREKRIMESIIEEIVIKMEAIIIIRETGNSLIAEAIIEA